MQKIVHLIWRNSNRGGFALGYVNFMKLCMPEYEHHFFVKIQSDWQNMNVCNDENMHYYENMLPDILSPRNIRLLYECDKIIISGWLLSHKTKLFLILSGLVSKCYFQFWDVKFSRYWNFSRILHPKRTLTKLIMHKLINKSAGLITLIDGDIKSVMKLFPNRTKHFVAPMPSNPLEKHDFEAIRAYADSNHFIHKILVAHSAFPDSLHIEAFHMIEHLRDKNIEIISPLSYGNTEYRNKVIEKGKKIFGEKFRPLLNYVDKEEYIRLLASCDAAIFTTYNQQGMGNISLLLRLGKKVYLREGTAMWEHYTQNMKYIMYPVSELENITLQELINFPEELAYNNIQIAEERAASNYAVEQWRKVFED